MTVIMILVRMVMITIRKTSDQEDLGEDYAERVKEFSFQGHFFSHNPLL